MLLCADRITAENSRCRLKKQAQLLVTWRFRMSNPRWTVNVLTAAPSLRHIQAALSSNYLDRKIWSIGCWLRKKSHCLFVVDSQATAVGLRHRCELFISRLQWSVIRPGCVSASRSVVLPAKKHAGYRREWSSQVRKLFFVRCLKRAEDNVSEFEC